MAFLDDFTLDYVNKTVKHTSWVTVYTANQMYSALQDEFDELGQMDDTIPMSAQTPTSYSIINWWYMSPVSTQYISWGAIQTSWYLDEIHQIKGIAAGYVSPSADIGKVVQDDWVDFGTLIDYDDATYTWYVRTGSSTVAASSSAMTIPSWTWAVTNDTAATLTWEVVYANPYTLGTIEGNPQLYIYQAWVKLTSWWTIGHFDILVKVDDFWVAIDSRTITVFGRNWTDTGTNFQITLTTAGQNAVPLGNADDANNQSTEVDVEDLTDWTIATIAIDFSFTAPFSYDIWDGAWAKDYEVQIDCNGRPLSDVYEVMKWWTREDSVTQLETGADAATLNWEAYRYAVNTYAEVVASPLGTFAWGKAFMARSVYFINLHADDAQAFQLIDKTGISRTPPNYQSVVINSVAVWDRTAIYPRIGAIVDKSQYTSHATNNTAGDSTFEMTTSLIGETPDVSKFIVVATDELVEHTYRYTSKSGAILTMPVAETGTATGWSTTQLVDSWADFVTWDVEVGDIVYDSTNGEYGYIKTITDLNTLEITSKATSWNGAWYETNSLVQTYDDSDTSYVAYVLEEATWTAVSNTIIFAIARDVIAIVRKKGILPFETSGSIWATWYSATAIRTTDWIVT